MQVGDVVIVKEDNIPRNEWKLSRVVAISEDDDGLVRKVKIQIGQRDLGKKGEHLKQPSFLEHPIQKLLVLVEVLVLSSHAECQLKRLACTARC